MPCPSEIHTIHRSFLFLYFFVAIAKKMLENISREKKTAKKRGGGRRGDIAKKQGRKINNFPYMYAGYIAGQVR